MYSTDFEISSSISVAYLYFMTFFRGVPETEMYSLDGDKELREAQFIIGSPMLPITTYLRAGLSHLQQ